MGFMRIFVGRARSYIQRTLAVLARVLTSPLANLKNYMYGIFILFKVTNKFG